MSGGVESMPSVCVVCVRAQREGNSSTRICKRQVTSGTPSACKMAAMAYGSRPANVGVLAMEMYTPRRFVSQMDMETADNCSGKYVVGLGQLNMAFCDDREDIASIFLTSVHSLLEKYEIHPKEIGRIEIGTETLIDKSKSVKTSLMRLFGDNTDLEGVSNVNACYGGTAAVFNSIAWVESSDWDGRYALVVCGDIAVYEAGPARPTGGCGAMAILIGPDAVLAMEPGIRASHAIDCYDFYKPHHSEYAAVDGKLSQWAYLSSVDSCYMRYKQKHSAKHAGSAPVTAAHFDFFCFHTPYNKLAQKGFSRMLYMDARQASDPASVAPEIAPFVATPLAETYESRDIEAASRSISQSSFTARVMPSCRINQNVGNCYTASVYASLLSLVCEKGSDLVGKRVCLFSYGSGSLASMFSVIGRTSSSKFSLDKIRRATNMFDRLEARQRCSVEAFSAALDQRAVKYGKAPMTPDGALDAIDKGTYYLTGINDKHHRSYARM